MDRTRSRVDNAVAFEQFDPVAGRFVRLTLIGWPAHLPIGVVELTVFGQPVPPP